MAVREWIAHALCESLEDFHESKLLIFDVLVRKITECKDGGPKAEGCFGQCCTVSKETSLVTHVLEHCLCCFLEGLSMVTIHEQLSTALPNEWMQVVDVAQGYFLRRAACADRPVFLTRDVVIGIERLQLTDYSVQGGYDRRQEGSLDLCDLIKPCSDIECVPLHPGCARCCMVQAGWKRSRKGRNLPSMG